MVQVQPTTFHGRFNAGLVQMTCSLDSDENLAKAEARIRDAASRGAQIL